MGNRVKAGDLPFDPPLGLGLEQNIVGATRWVARNAIGQLRKAGRPTGSPLLSWSEHSPI
ncbi:MAG: hypothetical protein KAW17_04135 [Candidatus Eisenbacteria sp.]|nr:hypothetical protein [Candidatus Eisenbacteria bacterium]